MPNNEFYLQNIPYFKSRDVWAGKFSEKKNKRSYKLIFMDKKYANKQTKTCFTWTYKS